MGMSVGEGGKKDRPTPQMNVTPLVDVVLVLLIIFMVVTPLLAKQFWLELPKQDKAEAPPSKARGPLLVRVEAEGKILLNKVPVPLERLQAEVARAMADRAKNEPVFFEAADEVPYATAVAALDATRAGGGANIAVVTQGK